MNRRACFALSATVLLLAACQRPEPPVYDVETTRLYAQDQRAVFDGMTRFLEGQGVRIVGGSAESGMIRAERRNFEDAGWAHCEPQTVVDRTSNAPRRIHAVPVDRDLDLRIALRGTDSGTEVRLDQHFSEQQINPYTNLPFRAPCRSTGVLEAALLNSI